MEDIKVFELGTDLDYQDIPDRSALFYSKNKDRKTAEVLLKAGADVSMADDTGMNSIALAKAMGDRRMMELLLRYFKAKDKFQNAYKKIAKMNSLAKEINRAKNLAEVKKKWNSIRLMVDSVGKMNYLKKEREAENKKRKRKENILKKNTLTNQVGLYLDKKEARKRKQKILTNGKMK